MDDVKQVDRALFEAMNQRIDMSHVLDNHPDLQCIARHRISAEAATEAKQAAQIAELRELLDLSRLAVRGMIEIAKLKGAKHTSYDKLLTGIDTALKDTTS